MSSSGEAFDQAQDLAGSKNQNEEAALKGKKSRILTAVTENQLDVFIELFDSPKWYDMEADVSYSFLQLAILQNSKEVFDHMMSIPNFPLEYVNFKDETALMVALDGYIAENQYTNEHFAYELVKKGANLDVEGFLYNTPLHCAVQRSYCKLVKLLLEKGVDLNARNIRGETPLDLIPTASSDFEEILNALLLHGAEPSVKIFEKCVLENKPLHIQENLFLYLFDEYSDFEITFEVLVALVWKSPLFYELIKCPVGIRNGEYDMFFHFYFLCGVEIDKLKIIIEKFGDSLYRAFEETGPLSRFQQFYFHKMISIENLSLIVESDLNRAVMDFLEIWGRNGLARRFLNSLYTESTVTELCCYLLSYGCDIQRDDLESVYQRFGYCELFKLFLHLDVRMDVSPFHIGNIMALLIYDISMSLSDFFEHPNKYTLASMEKLLDYFVDPRLKAIYLEKVEQKYVTMKREVPEMPLLVELARNAFRKYFVGKFQIKTCGEFCTRVKCLPITHVCKKIITYETKLY